MRDEEVKNLKFDFSWITLMYMYPLHGKKQVAYSGR